MRSSRSNAWYPKMRQATVAPDRTAVAANCTCGFDAARDSSEDILSMLYAHVWVMYFGKEVGEGKALENGPIYPVFWVVPSYSVHPLR